jgi:hypothetical protein
MFNGARERGRGRKVLLECEALLLGMSEIWRVLYKADKAEKARLPS